MEFTDTPVLLGAKSHLRNERPLVLAVSTNDGLGIAAQNIGRLMAWRSVYFVPFRQDDPVKKPRSLGGGFCADSENAGFRPVRRAAAAHAGTGNSCQGMEKFCNKLATECVLR